MNESDVGSAPDSTAPPAADSSPVSQGSGAPSEQSSTDVHTQPVQGTDAQATSTENDPLAGIPSSDELKALVEQKVPHAEALSRLRSVYEPLKSQFTELETKFKPFESVADRFQSAEEVQSLVKLNDSLFGYSRDEQNQLVPATETFAEDLTTRDPLVADYLTADLMNGMTRHPETGQPISRIDLAIMEMANYPERRAAALKLLGGVEPTSIAPTWQPSAEELAVVNPELQDIYKQLPYDKRENLKLNDPAFINDYLEEQKFKQDLIAQNRQAQELQTRQQQQREQYIQQRAQEAGNQYVEQGFRTGMAEFAKSVVDRSQFVKPLDPQSPEAQAMAPEQVQQFNAQAQTINQGVGSLVAVVTAALAVPDTQWMMTDFLKGIGVDEKTLSAFNEARQQYARNARDYGELNFQATAGQNGNGHAIPAGLGQLQSNSSQAMKQMKGYGNLVAQPLLKLLSDFFELKATGYNSTLNTTGSVRPPVNGSNYDSATAQHQLPTGKMSRADIDRLYG